MFLTADPNDRSNSEKKNDKDGIYEKSWIIVQTEKAVDKGKVVLKFSLYLFLEQKICLRFLFEYQLKWIQYILNSI